VSKPTLDASTGTCTVTSGKASRKESKMNTGIENSGALSSVQRPGLVNPASSLSRRQPVWNSKKAILYGTPDKINPTTTTLRRLIKISRKLGPSTLLYLWIVERIHLDKKTRVECTKFKIADAAEELGVNEKRIDRWLKALRQGGWISSQQRRYMGRNTYCTYFVNPINELIQDDGHASVTSSQRRDTDVPTRRDTDVPAKRANKDEQRQRVSPSSPPTQGSKTEGAGRASHPAPACFAPRQGEGTHILDDKISQFLRDNESIILGYGFKPNPIPSLVKDVQSYFQDDAELWDLFVENWPLLRIKLRHNQIIKKSKPPLGFGWLFLQSKLCPEEINLQVVLFSSQYDKVEWPTRLYKPDTEFRLNGCNRMRVLEITDESPRQYWCCLVDQQPEPDDEGRAVPNRFRIDLNSMREII
jgi:hypothetical protein